ncbi:MAG: NYN domain-containing protein [Chthoniobacterales bacterium]
MQKRDLTKGQRSRVLVLVDESNVGSSVRTAGRGLDWLKLRDFLAGPNTGHGLIEMVVYAGLPPAMPTWQDERDKKNKFVQWLRANGFMVMTKDGSPAEEGHYKANVDVMMAIDAMELSIAMRPDIVILVTGDADFAYLATQLRRHGIRIEVASVAANLGQTLRSAANEVIDLAPLFRTFEMMNARESGGGRAATQAARSGAPLAQPAPRRNERAPQSHDSRPSTPRPPRQGRRRRGFRPAANRNP